MNKKVSIITLGCRYNLFESAEIEHELREAGYENVQKEEQAGLVVINSCSVTDKSDARCRAAIRKARMEHPNAKIVVAGCYAETNPEELLRIEEVDIVAGKNAKFSFVSNLDRADGEGAILVENGEQKTGYLPLRPVTNLRGRTNAYLNIQGGCDEECSFCIVRIARGNSRSALPADLINRINAMHDFGIREIVLSGINLGDYRSGDGDTLADLLGLIETQTDIERIRLSSINPNTIDDRLIETIAGSDRICNHLHIPLQSGSDKILRIMKRPYSSADYKNLLQKLVSAMPDIGIGADIMVAFPGESEKDFEESFSLLAESPVTMLHVFSYSPREGTTAFEMKNRIEKQIAKKRSARLKDLSAMLGKKARNRFIGKTLSVLAENSRDRNGFVKGFSRNYLPVAFEGSDELLGDIVEVRITAEENNRLVGECAAATTKA